MKRNHYSRSLNQKYAITLSLYVHTYNTQSGSTVFMTQKYKIISCHFSDRLAQSLMLGSSITPLILSFFSPLQSAKSYKLQSAKSYKQLQEYVVTGAANYLNSFPHFCALVFPCTVFTPQRPHLQSKYTQKATSSNTPNDNHNH